MGISIDNVSGRGIIFYGENDNYKDEIISFIKYINPNFFINNKYCDDSLEIVLHENSLLDIHLGMRNIGNCVTGKGAGMFIKVLSDLGEDVLVEFGKTIEDVNEVCIM